GRPVEERIHDDRARHVRGAVVVVDLSGRTAKTIREDRLVPGHVALDRPSVWIEQQLRGQAALTLLGRPRTVYPIAVALAGGHAWNMAVMHEAGLLGQRQARLIAVVVE